MTAQAQHFEMRSLKPNLVVQSVASGAPTSGQSSSSPVTVSPVYSAEVTATRLDFGGVAVGQTDVKSFGVLNTGNQPLSVGAILVSDPRYSVVTSCGASLAPGSQCSVEATFRPSAAQAYTGLVTVSANVANSPLSVALSGTGLQAVTALAADTSADFGQVTVGQSVARAFTLTNTGNIAATNVVPVLTGSSGLALSNSTCGTASAPAMVQAGGTCTMTVTYTPTAPETLSNASLSVTSSASGSPATVTLTGAAAAPSDPYAKSLAILLHFDGVSGTQVFTDSSGHATSATVSGAPVLSSSASVFGGSSVSFNGSSSVTFNTTTSADASSDFTAEYWVKTSSAGGGAWASPLNGGFRFTKFETTSGTGYGNTSVYTGDLYFEPGAGGGNNVKMVVSRNGKWNDGNWHHIAVTRSKGVLRGFVDGVQQLPSLTATWSYPAVSAALGQAGFKGYVDEVRVTNGVARYTANFTVPTSAFPSN
jgi:uncharacterized repeat protein (TIGR01451 family)